jgi:hypothetical protein
MLPTPIIKIILKYVNIDENSSIRYRISNKTTFDVLEWYKNLCGLTDEKCYKKNRIFLAACEAGNLDLAKELRSKLSLSRVECLGYEISELTDESRIGYILDVNTLSAVCINGHLQVFLWLVEEFNISTDEIHYRNGTLFSSAAYNGKVDMFKYLMNIMNITESRIDNTFEIVCNAGQLEICQLLFENYQYSWQKKIFKYFEYACRNNRLDVAKYIRPKIDNQENQENREIIVKIFQKICEHSKLRMMKWYAKTFVLTPAEIASDDHQAYNNIHDAGNVAATIWLFKAAKYEEIAINELTKLRSL